MFPSVLLSEETVLADKVSTHDVKADWLQTHTRIHTRSQYKNACWRSGESCPAFWWLHTFLFVSDLTESTGQVFFLGSFAFLFQKPDLNFQNNIYFFLQTLFVPEERTETSCLVPSRVKGWTGRHSGWQVALKNTPSWTLCHLALKHWKQTKLLSIQFSLSYIQRASFTQSVQQRTNPNVKKKPSV